MKCLRRRRTDAIPRVKWRNGSYFKQFGYIPTEIRTWSAIYYQFASLRRLMRLWGVWGTSGRLRAIRAVKSWLEASNMGDE